MELESVKAVTLFCWRDRNGVFHPINTMETRHLYYTLLMIWNHSAPEHLKYRPFNEYTFNSFYTAEYFLEAVKAIVPELQTRKLPDAWAARLMSMSMALHEYSAAPLQIPQTEEDR